MNKVMMQMDYSDHSMSDFSLRVGITWQSFICYKSFYLFFFERG